MGSIPTASIFLFKSRQFLLVDSFTNFTYLATVFSCSNFCESGGIGRRAGLRIQSRKGWGFDSPLSHNTKNTKIKTARKTRKTGKRKND